VCRSATWWRQLPRSGRSCPGADPSADARSRSTRAPGV
jgi:hypothetical protein